MKKLIHLLRDNAQSPHSIRFDASSGSAHVYLKGVISADWGVSAADLRDSFDEAAGAPVTLHINSPGGDVFEGREMQAVIAGYSGKVTAVVEGVAASAATIVAMAASTTQMVKGSRYMIHNGWTLAMGDRHAMLDMHNLLASFDAELAAEYAAYTGQDASHMTALMDAETWFTADQALENKFISSVLDNTQNETAKASIAALKTWNLSAYKNAPQLEDEPPPQPDWKAVHANNARRLRLLRLA